MICRVCDGTKLEKVLDLGNQPWCNHFLKPEEVGTEPTYPLRVVFCHDCSTTQLDYTVKKEIMFGDHTYLSGVTKSLSSHFKSVADEIDAIVPHKNRKKTVLDIGSNDGTQLKHFQALGYEVLGVESSKTTAKIAMADNVPTLNAFFNLETAKTIGKKFDVINAAGVFFHLEELHSVTEGIRESLEPDGTFMVQFLYMKKIVENLAFDQIYHEHYYYWMITPLAKLFAQYGLSIISVSEHAIHGGTMRIISTNRGRGHCEAVQKYIDEESLFDFKDWGMRVHSKIKGDEEIIRDLLKMGKVACFGAGAKSCVYLNCINQDLVKDIEYVVDDTLVKQGKFMPGTSLCVVDRTRLYEDQPDYLILLIHNFKDHIITSLRPQYKGTIIVMVPTLEKYS